MLNFEEIINIDNIKSAAFEWRKNVPFPHFYVDNFFKNDVAKDLESEFPDFEDKTWYEYGNALEIKKLCNNWNAFPKLTYSVFSYLNSDEFLKPFSDILFGKEILFPDYGLNGGGWHIHKKGGKLNTHLDYSLHPKLGLQRKINIIIYLNSEWNTNWGGSLGLWSNKNRQPDKLEREIEAVFNRAVIFDTTCNSWHGLPNPLTCPDNQYRKSMAVYYLTEPPVGVDSRGKALFAPSENQKENQEVLELIKKRSDVNLSSEVYRENKL